MRLLTLQMQQTNSNWIQYFKSLKVIAIQGAKYHYNETQVFTYRQSEGQTFNDFVTELKKLIADCAFDTLKDSLIKDVSICGVSDHGLRERMLREPDIN